MADPTREQIEAMRVVYGQADMIDALCAMALRAIDADDEIATLRAALTARGVVAPAYYARTAAERESDTQTHARRITRDEAAWMTFSMRAHHDAQKPRALDTDWQPMSTAPRDGRPKWFTIDSHGTRYVALHRSPPSDAVAWMYPKPPFTGDPATLEPSAARL